MINQNLTSHQIAQFFAIQPEDAKISIKVSQQGTAPLEIKKLEYIPRFNTIIVSIRPIGVE